ncbi:uncharacterized protein [Musca autumnalis]|uniref:uncharacterized protein n=1 Tax=Musca autumnalis TaxID=221902 RepID=UPI003CF15E83
MIICGNIYLDEIKKSFILQCVFCEIKSKGYTEFTKHIKKKHKTLDGKDVYPDDDEQKFKLQDLQPEDIIVSPIIKREDDILDTDNEDEKPLLQVKHELKFMEEGPNGMQIGNETGIDPMDVLEGEVSDDKDQDYVPDNESDDDIDSYEVDVDENSQSESENEEMPVTDKFVPTFFRKQRFLENFLDFYKDQPVLWDVNNSDFENEMRRKDAQNAIIFAMQKFNIFMKTSTLNQALNSVHKYCAVIKDHLESKNTKKLPKITLGYYEKCDFLKDLLIKKNITGAQFTAKEKPLQLEEWNEKTSTFIDVYSTFPILYNGDHPSYGDVDGRHRALEEFSSILKDQHCIDFNEDITSAIEQLQSWYYKLKRRKVNINRKLNQIEEKYYKKCCNFLPNVRVHHRFVCSVCKETFVLQHKLQIHLYKIHQIGDMPFGCDQCERRFESKLALNIHRQRTHVGKTYACKFCDKKFSVESEMKVHSTIHSTEKRHVCELCGKAFRLKVQLRNHVTAIHTKIRAFKCTMCPKDFIKKRDLTDHIKSHLNIRDKICETCGKGFSNCHSLIRHRQIHSDVKKFACKLCDAKFHQFVGLNGHMKRTHNIIKKPTYLCFSDVTKGKNNKMIICGNIYLDEIKKSFVLQCVFCEIISKGYTEFTKHIKKKHKTLDGKDVYPDGDEQKFKHQDLPTEDVIASPIIKQEDDILDSDNEDEKPLLQIKHELKFIEDGANETQIDNKTAIDPMDLLEENNILEFPNAMEGELSDDKDQDYVPESDDDIDSYEVDVDENSQSESENEEMPVTDKFVPTFFRKQRFLENFLDFYKDQPVLWDVNNSDFENEMRRKDAQNAIIFAMQKFNIFMKTSTLNQALNSVHKYCAVIKDQLESKNPKKLPKITLEYYKKCDFLKDLLIKKNITGSQFIAKVRPLQLKEWDEKTSTFIDVFSRFPILYNGDHPSYGDVDGRHRALEEFSSILKGQHSIDFNEDTITSAIEQLQSWYYKLKRRNVNQNRKLSKIDEKYYKKCRNFLPNERVRYRFVCNICKKTFILRHKLQTHLYKIHKIGDMPIGCDQCEKRFESKFALNIHTLRVHVGKTYACKYCDKKFAIASELTVHSTIHSKEKRHVCELCGKAFRLKVQLRNHVTAIHTKIRAFKCTMCPKDFYFKKDLTYHIKSHLNIKDKICETCGKGFSSCHSLIRHRQIHSEVKKFACKLCDAKFHQFVGLNGHMKRTHNIIKKPT